MEKIRSAARGKKVQQVDALDDASLEESASEEAKAIGQRMREARQALGLSQVDLAAKLGASKPGLQQNEAGKNMPGGRLLYGFSMLGVSSDWLLCGQGEMFLEGHGAGTSHPPSPVDSELLAVVLERLEAKIAAAGVRVSAKKKAELAVLLYDYITETGNKEGPSIDRILRLVA
ncbi:XRE family transcriptional regulator [Cupriavidus basilensis OR16]|uniref:XRE family transcriptional regulator n=1 Tax=Cupriavidus basilensis OR16 TaxID=1127483 RepID=H1SDK4_9BURK|nr:helix-turn-helix domain-containing protein [Cupriavidus basilensis]EHP39389.1 XRE family transcriptional regulator [Cupriavidus basilensis OR16]